MEAAYRVLSLFAGLFTLYLNSLADVVLALAEAMIVLARWHDRHPGLYWVAVALVAVAAGALRYFTL